jgi:prevent-host-death family protein
MAEIRVGTRELKSKLSEYLRRVKAGETLIVTEHGKPIGQLGPIKVNAEERLAAMLASGQASWNGQKLGAYQPATPNRGDRELSELIVDDRQ